MSHKPLINLQHILQWCESHIHIQLCEFRLPICSQIFIAKTPVASQKQIQKVRLFSPLQIS